MKDVILVTGGLGFIGKKLVEKLKLEYKDYKIVVLDQYIRDYDDYIRSDITDFGEIYTNVKRIDGNIKYIIHAASEVGRINGEEHPWKMIDSAVKGTLNLINISLEYDAKFVYFSTSEVYGDIFDDKEVIEDDMLNVSPLTLNNVYAISKLFGESLVRHYVKNYGLKAVGIRPFMVYGPGVYSSKYKSALDIFTWKLLNCEEINVDENCVRSWCHIDDFIEGILLIAKNHNFDSHEYHAYNIGNNKEYKTIEESAEFIRKELSADSSLIKKQIFNGKFKSQSKYFNTDKLENLGFTPKVSIEEGIKQMIDWYKQVKEENIK
ncbi:MULTISPECIES: NAD-dependent epimerase/dehydratase family protein [Clostridium]|uniref:NAD(P)-dependent oxidoreductase n=2 Tax=Clostridium TaxID=1485 RepID=A0A7X5PB57_CLOSG|nr:MULTISPECIES: NAD(P)-dependent oxidoreductase [Clostridium]AJD32310.1 3-beta hydroxysteroid dehydrogenase/isomerase family protein [Clostridium botulinum Prevot_594]AVP59798.1 NAD(P)-dependent oxidoreductase [Clostridium botulinum]AKC61787.1 NAD-dependent epimerase/dehydratase [Clostridium sporogenes]AKJ89096.1 epimerase [Clostridium sporogenes]AVP63469.1 NAD(P)-dependent oxidoreductase [Clostridium botulinum]